jgi:hypothetical protein
MSDVGDERLYSNFLVSTFVQNLTNRNFHFGVIPDRPIRQFEKKKFDVCQRPLIFGSGEEMDIYFFLLFPLADALSTQFQYDVTFASTLGISA